MSGTGQAVNLAVRCSRPSRPCHNPHPAGRSYDASSFVGHVDGLEPDLAYEMADAFFRMLYDPLRRSAEASAGLVPVVVRARRFGACGPR